MAAPPAHEHNDRTILKSSFLLPWTDASTALHTRQQQENSACEHSHPMIGIFKTFFTFFLLLVVVNERSKKSGITMKRIVIRILHFVQQ